MALAHDPLTDWLSSVQGPSLEDLIRRPAWMAKAACRGKPLEVFFPVRGETTKAGKEFCAGCAVRPECLDYAQADSEIAGIWGGTSTKERTIGRRN